MNRPMLALTAVALATALSACGGENGDDPTVAAPESASPSASAAPSAEAETEPEECPLLPVEGPVPEGASTDLSMQPTVTGSAEPPPTEVQVADIVEGDGAEVAAGDQVEVKYVGAFYDSGEEFDSSWSRGVDETLPFGVCEQGVIPGFSIGPIGMKEGGRREITIPSELGYGAEGSPPTIPGGAALVFVIDLVAVT